MSHARGTVGILVVDSSWEDISPSQLRHDYLDVLEASDQIAKVLVGGRIGRLDLVSAGKFAFHPGADERQLLTMAHDDSPGTGVLRVSRWGKFSFPLKSILLDEVLKGFHEGNDEGWMQLDLADVPLPYLGVEVLGADVVESLIARPEVPMNWEQGMLAFGNDRCWRVNASNSVRAAYLGDPTLSYFTFPKFVAVETTRLCNLRCTMCVTHSDFIEHEYLNAYPKEVDEKVYESIIDQLQPYHGYVSVAPQFQGEPFLSKKLPEMVSYAKERDITVGFTSNATLWKDADIQWMIDYDVDNLRISLDGASASSFEAVRIGAKYDQVIDNVEKLIDKRRDRKDGHKPSLVMGMTVLAINSHERSAFLDRWVEDADIVTFNNVCVNDIVPEKNFEPDRYPCPFLWEGMHVLTNGDVVPCCRDNRYEEVMGNAGTQPIDEIWNGEKYKRFRELHLAGRWDEIDICKRCDTWMVKTSKVEIKDGLVHRTTPVGDEYRKPAMSEPLSIGATLKGKVRSVFMRAAHILGRA